MEVNVGSAVICQLCEEMVDSPEAEARPGETPTLEVEVNNVGRVYVCTSCQGDYADACVKAMRETIRFQFHDISLVKHCPYCGTDDWEKEKLKPDGKWCNHPTKIRVR